MDLINEYSNNIENSNIENSNIENSNIENSNIENSNIENSNIENSNNINNLNNIKTIIENMDKLHHIEILKILINEDDIYINENNNGTFINLSELDKSVILKLEKYIEYFINQQNHLINLEDQKKQIENSYFN
jgi:uncharacterized protein YjbI with pentapeptide repeats